VNWPGGTQEKQAPLTETESRSILWFRTTWGNGKPGNCIYSLKCFMWFCQQTHNT